MQAVNQNPNLSQLVHNHIDWSSLPPDIWGKIAEYLPITTLYKIRFIRRRWAIGFNLRVCKTDEFVKFVLSDNKITYRVIKYLLSELLVIEVNGKPWNNNDYKKNLIKTLNVCKERSNGVIVYTNAVHAFIHNAPLLHDKTVPDSVKLTQFASKINVHEVISKMSVWLDTNPHGVVNSCYSLTVMLIVKLLDVVLPLGCIGMTGMTGPCGPTNINIKTV